MCGDPSTGESRAIQPIPITGAVLEAIYAEARAAFPAECCGWIIGNSADSADPADPAAADLIRTCANAQAEGEHPTAADRGAETAYVIAGDDLLDLSRSFSGERQARIIYHSHPNGRAYFSSTDREVATSPWGDGPAYPVQQLVVGISQGPPGGSPRLVEAAQFAWSDNAGAFVEVARWAIDAV